MQHAIDTVNTTLNDILAELDAILTNLRTADAQGEPDLADEIRYYRAEARHYAKAQFYHLQGVRATHTGAAWLVPSGSRAGLIHRLALVGDVRVCDCEAGANGRACWHSRLIDAYERADHTGAPTDWRDDPGPLEYTDADAARARADIAELFV